MHFFKLVQALAIASSAVVLAAPVSQRAVIEARSLPIPGSAIARLEQRADATTYTVKSGDTGETIAAAQGVPFSELDALNPGVNWYVLQIGSTLNLPGAGAGTGATKTAQAGSYTVQAGDTGNAIAVAKGISFEALSAANPGVNWNNLQIGQVLNLPSSGSPSSSSSTPASSPAAAAAAASPAGAGFYAAPNPAIPATPSTTTEATTEATTTTPAPTPTLTPTSTTTAAADVATSTTAAAPASSSEATGGSGLGISIPGSAIVIGVNAATNSASAGTDGKDAYTFYKGDGSSGSGWPAIDQWVSFDKMWSSVENVIGTSCQASWNVANNSPDETATIKKAIQAVAAKSMVDQRLILATIIQESSGCVRVPTTISPDGAVVNPGLMQDFNGSGSCNKDGQVQNPCPESEIVQMIEDGVMGTGAGSNNLVTNINGQASFSGSEATYRAARQYNSGSIPSSGDLGGPGATRCYASDIANRLTGWVSAPKTCSF